MRESRELEIVATLGPASWDLVPALEEAGATGYRISASHMTAEELGFRATAIREEMPASRLIIDLQGAKMRLGCFDDPPSSDGIPVIAWFMNPGA